MSLLVLVVSLMVTAASCQRGVDPQFSSQYGGTQFRCRDGSGTVSRGQVNDDFCDCLDGSDEPGTAACASSTFYCANAGYKPEQLKSSWVNDGVCDCCDGSDEPEMAACANTCDELGRAYRQAQQMAQDIRQRGYQLRLEQAQTGRARRAEQRARVSELMAQQTQQQAQLDDAQKLKEDAELPERTAKEAFDKEWDEAQAARKRQAIEQLFETLDLNADGGLALDELMARPELDGDQDGQVTLEEAEDILDIDGDGTVNETESSMSLAIFMSDVYESIQGKFAGSAKEAAGASAAENEQMEVKEEEADEDAEDDSKVVADIKPEYPDNIKALVVIADKARALHREVENSKRTTDDELRKLQEGLAVDLGPDDEFFGLQGQCYELAEGEYVYEICPFDKVTQKQTAGGRSTSLGRWKGWEPVDHIAHAFMMYDNGEKCWNGPARSCKVQLECGVEVKVLAVAEPNRCEYTMRCVPLCLCPRARCF